MMSLVIFVNYPGAGGLLVLESASMYAMVADYIDAVAITGTGGMKG